MRITKLDGLRGIFSLMIFFHHYDVEFLPDLIYNNFLIRESFLSVDFFFVLSGFVISYNYNSINTIKSFWIYLKKRFIRLYPLLFFSTILFLGFKIISNTYFPLNVNKIEDVSLLIYQTFNTLLFTNSTPILGVVDGMNGPSWSISAEVISYIIFGLVSLYSIGRKRNLVLILIITLGVIFSILNRDHFTIGEYSFVRGLISFNLGYFVWFFSQRDFKLSNKLEYLIPVLFCVLIYKFHGLEGFTKQIFGLSIFPLFFGLSILIFIKTNGYLSKILNSSPFSFLGNISYSIYLNHFLLKLIIPRGFFVIIKIPQNSFTEILVFVFTIFTVIIFSYFTYKIVEKKGGQFLKRRIFS